MIANIITKTRLLRQYRIRSFTHTKLGISRRHLTGKLSVISKTNLKSFALKSKVHEFLERDDNSRLKADKQATKSKGGMKKQIRLLNDDLKSLHAKFLSENNKISYSLFCQLRPFWVIKPSEKDRETCLCKIHDNLRLKLNAAHHANMYDTKDVEKLARKIVCDESHQKCMYRDCQACKDRKLPVEFHGEEGKQLSWKVWKTKRFEKDEKNPEGKVNTKTITRIIKDTDFGSKQVLSEEINNEMERACHHIFNIRQQYSSLRLLREKIEEDELIIHCDFSENYSCKYASEIQSMHFGASKRQISLHTGIAYCGQEKIPFCSVSDSLKHGLAAIWAHLDPVIMYMKSERSVIKGLHFITDGPTTQYRNKQNFYMWSKKVADFGFTRSTWNFLEAGHGKGAADGIGASVKRSADNQVNIKAKDITNAKDFLICMADTISKVKFFEVSEDNITSMEAQLPGNLLPIPNTMKIHQLVFHGVGLFSSRYVSCFCSFPEDLMCKCFQPTKITICTTKQSISSLKGKQQSEGELNENNLKLQTEKANIDMNLDRIYDLDESLVSRYCVVSYDNKPYPGVITAVDDEEIEVKVMHSIGKNRFFWPRMEDVLWYKQNKIITLLQNQPKQVTNRLMKLDDDVWKLIEEELDL